MIFKEKSLQYTHPELAAEWHPTKNGELMPTDITYGSGKKVWWKCKNGHEWEYTVNKRTLRGAKCPYCSNRLSIPGETDLVTVCPDIAAEWHPTNNTINPSEVSIKSPKKVWWLCSKCGYEWEACIRERTSHSHTGCPRCSARRSTSFPEQALYFYIRKIFPDAINRYKDIFTNGSELDIYIPSMKLGIEYDGAHWHQHDSAEIQRREQTKFNVCREHGIYLLRIVEKPKQDITTINADETLSTQKLKDEKNLEQVIRFVLDKIDPESNPWTRNKLVFHSSVDVNIERDRYEILSYMTDLSESSFGLLFPELSKNWDYSKNGTVTPFMVTPGSNISFYWKCHSCGHEWRASVNSCVRSGKGRGCPKCSLQKRGESFSKHYLEENPSLEEANPTLALEWHPTKNGQTLPSQIPPVSQKKFWWLCPKCGYEWQASPGNRSKGVGCPCCSGRDPKIGVNDFATKFPELALEWHPTKNEDRRPQQYLPKSGKKVWWLCPACGNEWETTIGTRVNGHGCPVCARKKRTK